MIERSGNLYITRAGPIFGALLCDGGFCCVNFVSGTVRSNGITGGILQHFAYGSDKVGNRMSERTVMTMEWIANRLQMGTRTHLHLLYWHAEAKRRTQAGVDNTIDRPLYLFFCYLP
jgi:hypothetical protein